MRTWLARRLVGLAHKIATKYDWWDYFTSGTTGGEIDGRSVYTTEWTESNDVLPRLVITYTLRSRILGIWYDRRSNIIRLEVGGSDYDRGSKEL